MESSLTHLCMKMSHSPSHPQPSTWHILDDQHLCCFQKIRGTYMIQVQWWKTLISHQVFVFFLFNPVASQFLDIDLFHSPLGSLVAFCFLLLTPLMVSLHSPHFLKIPFLIFSHRHSQSILHPLLNFPEDYESLECRSSPDAAPRPWPMLAKLLLPCGCMFHEESY